MVDADGESGAPAAGEDLRAFYVRYIAAFNARDEPAFFACFHLP